MHDLHVIQGPNVTRDARDKIAFFAFHAFVVEDSRFQPSSFPELRSPWPAVGKRELWEQPFQACAIAWNRWRLRLRSEPDNQNSVISHCYFKMDAPRGLVFRPLVKGNEALGTRLDFRKIELGPNYTTAAHAFVKATLRLGLRAPFVARNKNLMQNIKKSVPYITRINHDIINIAYKKHKRYFLIYHKW